MRRSQQQGELAPALKRRPEVWPDLQLYWNGYLRLSASRQGEQAPQRISVQEVVAYCDLIQLDDPEQRENMLDVVHRLDNDAFARWSAKMQAEAEQRRAARAARRQDA